MERSHSIFCTNHHKVGITTVLFVVSVCVLSSRLFFNVRLVGVPAGVPQEGYTGFLHLPSAVLALIFLARKIQPFHSLVDREVEFCVLTN